MTAIEVIIPLVDIGGIVDYHYLNFLFTIFIDIYLQGERGTLHAQQPIVSTARLSILLSETHCREDWAYLWG